MRNEQLIVPAFDDPQELNDGTPPEPFIYMRCMPSSGNKMILYLEYCGCRINC